MGRLARGLLAVRAGKLFDPAMAVASSQQRDNNVAVWWPTGRVWLAIQTAFAQTLLTDRPSFRFWVIPSPGVRFGGQEGRAIWRGPFRFGELEFNLFWFCCSTTIEPIIERTLRC